LYIVNATSPSPAKKGRVPGILDNPSLEKPIRFRVIDYQYVRHISNLFWEANHFQHPKTGR
jgi:hypothetical protein